MISRRALAALGLAWAASPRAALSHPMTVLDHADAIAIRLDARLGLAVTDHRTGRTITRNADDRFPMASTFKAFAAAALLARVDAGQDRLDRRIRFPRSALVDHSPVTETRTDGKGMTLADLCAAACGVSDNTAANLILEVIGGPPALTAFMRSIGDSVTRLDRTEPALNEATPGDPRDTTSPRAAAASLDALLLGNALSDPSREQLRHWMTGTTVTGPLLRAGIPADWTIADRSGAGRNGTRGIIAVMWPPGRPPITAAIYITEAQASMDDRNAAIAELGRAIAAELTQ